MFFGHLAIIQINFELYSLVQLNEKIRFSYYATMHIYG